MNYPLVVAKLLESTLEMDRLLRTYEFKKKEAISTDGLPAPLPAKPAWTTGRPLQVPVIPPKGISKQEYGEVDWDLNLVRVRHLVEFMTGKIPVDSSCTNDDLLCFALHMIMLDSGYQSNVSQLDCWSNFKLFLTLSLGVGCCHTHPRHLL